MFLQHYGSLIVSLVLIIFCIVASFCVLQTRRPYGSPRWPLLTLFGSVGLRGIAFFLVSIHLSTASSAVEIISVGVMWLAAGAVITQWFHETVLQGRPVRR